MLKNLPSLKSTPKFLYIQEDRPQDQWLWEETDDQRLQSQIVKIAFAFDNIVFKICTHYSIVNVDWIFNAKRRQQSSKSFLRPSFECCFAHKVNAVGVFLAINVFGDICGGISCNLSLESAGMVRMYHIMFSPIVFYPSMSAQTFRLLHKNNNYVYATYNSRHLKQRSAVVLWCHDNTTVDSNPFYIKGRMS